MLLSPPSKVQRKDGTSVPEGPQISLLTEAKAMWKLAISKDVLLMYVYNFCIIIIFRFSLTLDELPPSTSPSSK